jgi:ubiquinone biosynthesis protein COQ4
MKLPLTALSAVVGPLQLSPSERSELMSSHIQWAVACGQQSRFLLNVDYEKELHSGISLEDLREQLGIVPFPSSSA